jgi:hypothetical protein
LADWNKYAAFLALARLSLVFSIELLAARVKLILPTTLLLMTFYQIQAAASRRGQRAPLHWHLALARVFEEVPGIFEGKIHYLPNFGLN